MEDSRVFWYIHRKLLGCSSIILVDELVVTKPPWPSEAESKLSVSYRLESMVDELGHQISLAERSREQAVSLLSVRICQSPGR